MPSTVRPDISFNFRDARVLIVDRSQGYMDITAEMLLGFGFNKFDRYTNIETLKDEGPNQIHDLVLIDPAPDRDAAIAFIEALRQRDAASGDETLVIVITGSPGAQAVAEARDSGADYVVAKPFSPRVLLDRILWIADADPGREQPRDLDRRTVSGGNANS